MRGCTIKYNTKLRFGKGFTHAELKKAGLTSKFARTVGIAVDHRRQNTNTETLQRNVERLESYKSKLILFPRHEGKFVKGEIPDSTAERVTAAVHETTEDVNEIFAKPTISPREKRTVITEDQKKLQVYRKLRIERTNKHYKGRREERARRAAEEEK